MPTFLANQADVNSQSYDFPFIASARMRFSQPHDISQADLNAHMREL